MLKSLFVVLNESFTKVTSDPSVSMQSTRLFHGRGHCYEGLEFINIDWFDPVIWVVLYGDVEESVVASISVQLQEFAQQYPQIACITLQQRINGRAQQNIIYGNLPEKCYAQENGMLYELNFSANQNIGFFLDAQPARQWLKSMSNGKHILNLFAYTCSFSVAALQGGASGVVNIDMARSSIATGQRNHALNKLNFSFPNPKVSFLPHDIFRSTRRLESLGPYDIVVIDPPSRQKGSFEAEKDYPRLLKKLEPMLADNAVILACLNAPYLGESFLVDSFAQCLPDYKLLERIPARADFPEKDSNCNLKMQVFV